MTVGAKLSALFRQQKTLGAYARLFDLTNPDARAVLADASEYCSLWKTTACVNAITGALDSHAMAYAEGRRDALLDIIKKSNLDTTALQRAIDLEINDAA